MTTSTGTTESKPQSLSAISSRGGSIYYCLPEELVNDPSLNARLQSVTDADDLMEDFLNEEIGQLQPIGVRNTANGPTPVYGFRRLAAALEINRNKLYKGNPFKIACVSVDAKDDRTTFMKSAVENLKRKNTTPMDDAHNIERMVTDFGMTQAEVAKLYGKSAGWVSQTRSLMKLPAKDRKAVHEGRMPYVVAIELATVDPEEQKAIKEAVKETGGELTRESVVEAKRMVEEAKPEEPEADTNTDTDADAGTGEGKSKGRKGKAKGKGKKKAGRPRAEQRSRTLKAVRVFFVEMAEHEDAENDADGATAALGKQFLKWMDGGLTNNGMLRNLKRYGALIE